MCVCGCVCVHLADDAKGRKWNVEETNECVFERTKEKERERERERDTRLV